MSNSIFTLILTTIAAGAIMTGFDSPSRLDEHDPHVHPGVFLASSPIGETCMEDLHEEKVKEWKKLWLAGGENIFTNRAHLRELKLEMEKGEKLFDEFYMPRIEALEIMNDHLQTTLETYDMKDGHWESFKGQYDHDMIKLIQAIENLSVDYHYE